MRPGERIVLVDGRVARDYVGSQLKGASQIVVQDRSGSQRTITMPALSDGFGAALLVGALFFIGLGAVVFRWAADARLGLTFLIFGWAVAMTLVSIPAATMGYSAGFLVATPSAIVASSSCVLLFLIFPRPLAGTRWISQVVIGVTIALVSATAFLILANLPFPQALDTVLWLWVIVALVSALYLLVQRTRNPDDRRRLAPIFVGAAVGIVPLVILSGLPYAISGRMIVPIEFMSLALIGIPLGFTYAILRHRLFALDALVRYLLLRFVDVAAFVVIGVIIWSTLRRVQVETAIAVVLAVAVPAFVGPFVTTHLEKVIDRSLYGTIARARSATGFHQEHTVQELGAALTRQVRQLVPVQWSALVARRLIATNQPPEDDVQPNIVIAVDGDAPPQRLRGRWLDGRLVWLDGSKDRTVIPLKSGTRTLGAVIVGPRLNNAPPNALDVETIRILATQASAPFEAALLREQAEEERRFRDGLSGFARELAAAGSVEQVLQITAIQSSRLLRADAGAVWIRDATGRFARTAWDGEHADCFAATLESTPWVDCQAAPADQTGSTAIIREKCATGPDSDLFSRIWYRLGDVGSAMAIGVLIRQGTDNPFTGEDERRASEIVEHADGAFRRAHAFAQASEAETLREITRVRSEFLDIVSHDLQNPLAVILGFAELLEARLSQVGDPAVSNAITSILEATETSRRLIDDLLTSSRAERGRLSLQREIVDVGDFLGRVAHTYQVLPGGHRIRVEKPSETLQVSADVARLEQMVGNLMTNALRYSDSGPITLRARRLSPTEVCIEVRDHGRGIGPDDRARIWDRFYRTPSGESRTPRGVGVGLWIVRTLAELHGGRAEVESEIGQGSLFRIILPVVGAKPEPATNASSASDPTVAA